jgi:hypothetical protein
MPRRIPAHRIHRALKAVAELVAVDPVYMPIFDRLETELAAAEKVERIARLQSA